MVISRLWIPIQPSFVKILAISRFQQYLLRHDIKRATMTRIRYYRRKQLRTISLVTSEFAAEKSAKRSLFTTSTPKVSVGGNAVVVPTKQQVATKVLTLDNSTVLDHSARPFSDFYTLQSGGPSYYYERDSEGFVLFVLNCCVPKSDRNGEKFCSVPPAGFEPRTFRVISIWSQTLYRLSYADHF